MQRLPQRNSLVAQTAEVLREAIAAGQWPQWLPGELELTRRLRVSRVTLRAALAELEREKLIRGGQGRRREVAPNSGLRTVPTPSRNVIVLTPEPLHRLAASTVFWMDELREHLDAAGWPLEIHESASAYRRHPTHALEELVSRSHPAGWVLYRSTPQIQRWFSERALPAVIAGSRHPGVGLSSLDVDYAAGCRHAAGQFLAKGHRRVAIVRTDTTLAGDLESVSGFQEGMGDEMPSVVHDGSVRGICLGLDKLFAHKPFPTGLFVFHATHLLTVIGWLQRKGLHAPADLSLLGRDHEPFLEFALPTPARYEVNAKLFARKLSHLVASLVAEGAFRPRRQRMLPTFIPGQTLGPAAA